MIKKFYNADPNGPGNSLPEGHISKDKANAFIKEKISDIEVDKNQKQENLHLSEDNPDEEMGKNPANTLKGHIVASQYGQEIHNRLIEFRIKTDSLFLTAVALSKYQFMQSRELSLAITSFQSARQYTGKALQQRGAIAPYDKTGVKERTEQGDVIIFDNPFPATAEAYDHSKWAIETCAQFREFAEELIIDFTVFGSNTATTSWAETVIHMSILQGLMNGKMWLGELMAKLASK